MILTFSLRIQKKTRKPSKLGFVGYLQMSSFTTVLPLAHKDCRLLKYAPIVLTDSIYLRSMKSQHIGEIIQKRRSLAERISSKTKCIILRSDDTEVSNEDVSEIAVCATFALNSYAKIGASMCEYAFVFKEGKAANLTKVFSIPSLSPPSYLPFEIDGATQPDAVKTLFQSARIAIGKDRSLYTSMRRYNAALARSILEDKLVDITICLESIFSAQTEISFRFSLYNSIVTEENLDKRYDIFKMLKRLYKERSNVVHGLKAPDDKWIEAEWPHIARIARLSVIEKIDFLQQIAPADWQEHLDKRALGVSGG